MMGKREKKKNGIFSKVSQLFHTIGFTNFMSIFIVFIVFMTICMAFYLSVISVKNAYLGTLAVFGAATTPCEVGLSIVLNSAVRKSTIENQSGDGTGIKYAAAAANGFKKETVTAEPVSADSPPI